MNKFCKCLFYAGGTLSIIYGIIFFILDFIIPSKRVIPIRPYTIPILILGIVFLFTKRIYTLYMLILCYGLTLFQLYNKNDSLYGNIYLLIFSFLNIGILVAWAILKNESDI
jgi:hypothetical protein